MENSVYNKIIDLIDSKYLKEYLFKNPAKLRPYQYLDIVTHAPTCLERKRELLVELRDYTQDESVKKDVEEHLAALDEAMDRLFHFSSEKDSLIVACISYDDVDELPVYDCIDFFPATSYEGARLSIQRFNDFELDGKELEKGEMLPWYWELQLYRNQEDGTARHDYTYICSWDGEVQYFINENGSQRNLFGEFLQSLNLPVPYHPGDILYVDCRPYTQPAYCLITEVSDDCCGVQCIYRIRCDLIDTGAFKHGNYFEEAYDTKQYLSPLLRAELYEGELPPECLFMEKISEKLKQDSEYGAQLYEAWYDYKHHPLDKSYYIKPVMTLFDQQENKQRDWDMHGICGALLECLMEYVNDSERKPGGNDET